MLGNNPKPQTHPNHSLAALWWDEGEEWDRQRMKKILGADKDSSAEKTKAIHKIKAEQGINSAGVQPCSLPTKVTWEGRLHNSKLSFFLPDLLLRVMPWGMEYPFGLLGCTALTLHPLGATQRLSS